MSNHNHLEIRRPIDEMTRDLLRSELAECAIDSVMLDGVSRNQHYDLLVNNPYNLVLSRQSEYSDIQDEALF